MSSKPPKFEFRGYPPAKVAKVANLVVGETKLRNFRKGPYLKSFSPPRWKSFSRMGVQCSECPGCQENPWTHYPDLGAWCHRRMEPLVTGSPVCKEFNRGEVHPKQDHEQVPQIQPSTSPAPQEHVLTCAAPQFQVISGLNPRQAWGHCEKRRRGRFGCATACEAVIEARPGGHSG